MKSLGSLIYTPETASGEAISKVESHTPKIEVPETIKRGEPFDVRVSVGPHPSTPQHYIARVELYLYEESRSFNPILLLSVDFAPGYAEPRIVARLRLEKSGTLYALAYCNLHGLWESRKEVRVVE